MGEGDPAGPEGEVEGEAPTTHPRRGWMEVLALPEGVDAVVLLGAEGFMAEGGWVREAPPLRTIYVEDASNLVITYRRARPMTTKRIITVE